jgi:hypothetical protein
VVLVRKRTIPTERSPLVDEVSTNFSGQRGVTWSAQRIPTVVNLGFLDRSRYFLGIAPQLSSRGFSENLAEPGNEPGTSGSVTRNSDY